VEEEEEEEEEELVFEEEEAVGDEAPVAVGLTSGMLLDGGAKRLSRRFKDWRGVSAAGASVGEVGTADAAEATGDVGFERSACNAAAVSSVTASLRLISPARSRRRRWLWRRFISASLAPESSRSARIERYSHAMPRE
jgi:hypothetical protein